MENDIEGFLIFGAGGHGQVVGDLVQLLGHRLIGYVDSDAARLGCVAGTLGASIVAVESEYLARVSGGSAGLPAFALGLGDNRSRLAVFRALGDARIPALVHPAASISRAATVERGAVVLARAVVQVAASVGPAVIINTGAIIEHDCLIGEAAHVSPGAVLAGGVEVGTRAWIGAGATVIQNIRIGADAVVGAGAVIIRDVPPGAKVVGNPGRLLQ